VTRYAPCARNQRTGPGWDRGVRVSHSGQNRQNRQNPTSDCIACPDERAISAWCRVSRISVIGKSSRQFPPLHLPRCRGLPRNFRERQYFSRACCRAGHPPPKRPPIFAHRFHSARAQEISVSKASACARTPRTAASSRSGGKPNLRRILLTSTLSRARALSRWAQSTLTLAWRPLSNSCAITPSACRTWSMHLRRREGLRGSARSGVKRSPGPFPRRPSLPLQPPSGSSCPRSDPTPRAAADGSPSQAP